MTPQEAKIGTRLEFEILGKDNVRVGNTFVSQLLEHQQDGSIVISAPIYESRVVFVPTGVTVRLTFVHQLHGLLGFTAVIRSKEYRDNIAVLTAEPEGDIEKIQRREHFRLDIIVDARLWPDESDLGSGPLDKADAQAAKAAEAAPVKAYTKNLSGSGACIISDTDFPKGSYVRVELTLGNDVVFKARCVVLRNEQIEIRKGKRYELGVRFVEIGKRDQDNLIRYIFEQQRLLLKKEK